MAKRQQKRVRQPRRTFTKELKQQAVQMLLDGFSASSVSQNLGFENTNLVYPWKAEQVAAGGAVTGSTTFIHRLSFTKPLRTHAQSLRNSVPVKSGPPHKMFTKFGRLDV